MTPYTMSPDGHFYWDGAQWRSTVSTDGAWRWSGTAWVSNEAPSPQAPPPSSYASLTSLAVLVTVFLGLSVVVTLVSTFVFEFYFDLNLTFGEQEVVYDIDLGALAIFAIAAGLFLAWLRRSHLNLAALGARDVRFSSGGVIGWWFVPLACWWMPYRAVAEVWRASGQPSSATSHSVLLVFWWGTWVMSSVLINVSSLLIYPLAVQRLLFLLSAGATTVAAVLATVVVWSITERQATRWRQLQFGVATHAAEAALLGVPDDLGTSPVAGATVNSARQEVTGIGRPPQP